MTHWRLPLDVASYDSTPELSQEEMTALGSWLTEYCSQWACDDPRLVAALERLHGPLHDVFALCHLPCQSRRTALTIFWAEMYRSGRSFWAWTAEEWLQVIDQVPLQPGRTFFVTVAYLLCAFDAFDRLPKPFHSYYLATTIFGKETVDHSIQRVNEVVSTWGYGKVHVIADIQRLLCRWFLENRSPVLEDLTLALVTKLETLPQSLRLHVSLLTRVLHFLGILERPLDRHNIANNQHFVLEVIADVPEEWLEWAQRWRATSVLQPRTRQEVYLHLLQMGRWLQRAHPEITSPAYWTRELAADYVAAVDRMTVGEFATCHYVHSGRQGQPLSARAKASRLFSARKFFLDCQEWQWIPICFDPVRSLQTPRAIRAQIGPDPRVIADDVWAKLLWAGLNLSEEDLAHGLWATNGQRHSFYPIEMVRAVTLVWLFAGLRCDEILRLRLGCVRWQAADKPTNGNRVCLLHIPVNKTSTAFTKPVSPLVGEAIQAWESCRPAQPALLDRKTGECVQFLFAFRSRLLGRGYLNHTLIPVLCTKAGIPIHDARGAITSHRARATIASQLANAHEPMSLLELQQWLGHSSAQSTLAYVKLTPTTLTKAYTDAGYLDRNLRTIQVLLDRDALLAGAPANGQPYLFYDLGHGYCTYDFFDKCPHRMACAKCSFYRPKGSSRAQLLEAQANLQHLLQTIPLTEDERAAVEDGLDAVDKLNAKLADVPTPAGPTPRELTTSNPAIVPVESISTQIEGKD